MTFLQKYIGVSALASHIYLFGFYANEYSQCVTDTGCWFAESNIIIPAVVVGGLAFTTLSGIGIDALRGGDVDV